MILNKIKTTYSVIEQIIKQKGTIEGERYIRQNIRVYFRQKKLVIKSIVKQKLYLIFDSVIRLQHTKHTQTISNRKLNNLKSRIVTDVGLPTE